MLHIIYTYLWHAYLYTGEFDGMRNIHKVPQPPTGLNAHMYTCVYTPIILYICI